MTKLPTDAEEAELRWIEEELLRRLEADFIRQQAHAAATFSYEDMALAAAEQGSLRPLRSRYPHLAKFINPPKWPRGKHHQSSRPHGNYTDRVRWAYADKKNICALAKEFGRKFSRSAYWYAARLWDIREEDLKNFKPSGRKKPRA